MKSLLILCFVVAVAVALPRQHKNPDLNEHWELYKKVNHKDYDGSEDLKRRLIWEAAVETVAAHNRRYDMGLTTYRKGINKFADLTHEEFVVRFTGARPPTVSRGKAYKPSGKADAAEVDWRNEGAVTEVKNQFECGGCWSFSTTGSVEGQNFLKTGELISLSEQQLIDCSTAYGNMGCGGGWMWWAFQYVIDNGGLNTEADYPFQQKYGLVEHLKCRFNPDATVVGITGYVNITSGDDSQLQDAVANVGPVSVAIDASENLQLYSSGILDDDSCGSDLNSLNHGVLTIGYGTGSVEENSNTYWLVKNSWGADWGESGYFRFLKSTPNVCGISTAASYPTV
jgi:cathepsin L